jgi:AbrB family looped-hinge helix DNA binding protein
LTLFETEIVILRDVLPMKITSKGQVTIPVEIRAKLGLVPNSEVEFELAGYAVRIRKVRKAKGAGCRGKSLVACLRGKGSVQMTTGEVLVLTRSPR